MQARTIKADEIGSLQFQRTKKRNNKQPITLCLTNSRNATEKATREMERLSRLDKQERGQSRLKEGLRTATAIDDSKRRDP